MDLSVIIPIYNHEKYIKKCLETILEDFPSNSEIIIIDDVCTDKSIKIIESLHSPYIKILHNEKNMGCAYNLNRGIEAAQGKYIGINYSDDFVEKGFYKKMLEVALEKDADVVCANIATFRDDNNDTTYYKINDDNIYLNTHNLPMEDKPFKVDAGVLLGHWTAASASTKIIKKQFYDQYKFLGSKANDIPAIYPILSVADNIIYYPGLYLFYRELEDSLSRKNDKESYDSVVESIREAFCRIDEANKNQDVKEILFFNNCLKYLLYSLGKIPENDMKFECMKYFVNTLHKYDDEIFVSMKKSKYYSMFLKNNNITGEMYDLLEQNKIIEFILSFERKYIITEEEIIIQRDKIKTIMQEKDRVQAECMEKEKQIQENKKCINDMQEDNIKLEKQLIEKEKELVNKKEQIDNIIKERSIIIEKYENSKSWKITKPMRKLRNFFSKDENKKIS